MLRRQPGETIGGLVGELEKQSKKKSDFEKLFCDLKRKKLEDFTDVTLMSHFGCRSCGGFCFVFRFSIEVTL